MSMSDYELNLQGIHAVMSDPLLSQEEQLERRLDWIVRELDEVCAMAANPETVEVVDKQRVGVGQIVSRSQLIASFLLARKPGPKVVANNG